MPLSDCAPIVVAEALGLFKKHGVAVELSREIGWATIRDKMIYGEIDAAHAPAGMMVAASAGLGSIPTPCLTALVINANGNAITLSQKLWKRGVQNGADFKRMIEQERGNFKFTLGTVFSYSSHTFLLRAWLRTHGIDPVRDVHLVVVPPSQMAPNLKAGNLDGYCVGEPWNSAAVTSGTGFIAATSRDIAPGHPEKVLMVKSAFAESRSAEHLALIAALAEACAFCDDPDNRDEMVATLARRAYLGAPLPIIRASMGGSMALGNKRVMPGQDFHLFSRDRTNAPSLEKAQWVIRSLQEDPAMRESEALRALRPSDLFREETYQQALRLHSLNHEN